MKDYQPRGHRGKRFQCILNKFLDQFDNKTTLVADIGGDNCVFTKLLLNKGFKVYAFDLEKSEYHLSNVKFMKVDLNYEVIKIQNKFDLVLCTEVAEHLEDQYNLFMNLKNIMKKGSKLIFSVPNLHSIYARLYFLLKGSPPFFPLTYTKGAHINPLFLNEIRILAKKFDFSIDFVGSEGLWIPIIRKYLGNKYDFSGNYLFGKSLVIIMTKL